MKRFILFILILLSNTCKIFSCGYYPYGEDVRFSMYNIRLPQFKEFEIFNYSSNTFGSDYTSHHIDKTLDLSLDDNLLLWSARYQNAVPLSSINDAIYVMDSKGFVATSPNAFIRFLFKKNDTTTVSYIKFAKKCSDFNTKFEDPWERQAYVSIPGRRRLIHEAIKTIARLHDEELIKRYAFIAIRLAFYNNDQSVVQNLYSTYFTGTNTNKNIVDYWSMYFLCLVENDSAKVNFYAAQVFAHASDKRFMVSQQYSTTVPIEQTLRFAKTKAEKAAVWLLAGIKNPERALTCMKKIYALEPNAPGLSFLLLREVNKLEDWIYTPLYTEFAPSVDASNRNGEDSFDSIYKERIRKDRLYARDVYAFTQQVTPSKVYVESCWKTAQIYLLIMTQRYQEALDASSKQLKQRNTDNQLIEQLEMFHTFCLVAVQSTDHTHLSEVSKSVLMKQHTAGNYKFVFAIAKELEFRNNSTDAAALLSTLNVAEITEGSDGRGKTVFWRTRKGSYLVYGSFYTNYFEYIDFQYTPDQIRSIIASIKQDKGTDVYSLWAYKRLHTDINVLHDLTGTKYMRENNLPAALRCFKQVPDSCWQNERYRYLDANPFYTNFYNEHNRSEADTITYTKKTLVETLSNYLRLANDPATKDRDYYYFLAANCYLNMTSYGNSWMMKRYALSSSPYMRTGYNDMDFIEATHAKQYYLKAKQCSKTKKFAALCLRMAGRCEKYAVTKRIQQTCKYTNEIGSEDQVFTANKYYRQLKKEYPDDYDELISNCESFTPYFLARR